MGILRLFRSANVLSLDVATGAICGTCFFADFFNVPISFVTLAVLFLTVWVAYTTDHLVDAFRMGASARTERHRFHRTHFRVLLVSMAVVVPATAVLTLQLPRPTVLAGLGLGAAILLYYVASNLFPRTKEFLAAGLYTAGVLVPVADGLTVTLASAALVVQFYSLALMNLLIFSWFDREVDVDQNSLSFVTFSGKKTTGGVIWAVFMLNCAFLLWREFDFHVLLLWLIGGGHMAIFASHRYLRSDDTFRILGDALFLLPVLALLWP